MVSCGILRSLSESFKEFWSFQDSFLRFSFSEDFFKRSLSGFFLEYLMEFESLIFSIKI